MIRLTPPKFYGCEACRPEDFLACRSCGLQNLERSKPDPASLGAFAALTPGFIAEFSALRKRLAEALAALLKEDPHHKSYEGTWELTFGFGSVFEDPKGSAPPCFFLIKLHCYLMGPSRHYEWGGTSWEEALLRCRRDVEMWIKEAFEIDGDNDAQES